MPPKTPVCMDLMPMMVTGAWPHTPAITPMVASITV